MQTDKKLVLWDIDHTLISLRGFGRMIYGEAFLSVTGQPMREAADLTMGGTDRAMSAEMLRSHGIADPTGALLESLGGALAEAFVRYEAGLGEYGGILAGAVDALTALAGRDDVIQSVLTGNMEPIAIGKLRAFGLDRYVDFAAGAYGMDHEDRPELVRMAQERAAVKYGGPFTGVNTVLIGDTPNDVRAGRLGGARVVAVATGSCDADMLRAAGADLILPDLADTEQVIAAVLGTAAR
ncbi:hypothetical protein DP939_20235 [Spongiactinospora rosea]|uniref:Phosphoglycolate phosphatase-like HAD superfamily hydrolase n=1 Tax=Spongiactinospora rosea TaxID=2248750 RepID=A0A366LYZ5_9ACTN|nr:HAD hydrolase-like protein [Spongiactinospora rosea]RBQ18402.1 hypothetical protein DP939_20235 [Spongiactinospora rosea]